MVEAATNEFIVGPDNELNERICNEVNLRPRDASAAVISVLQSRIRTGNPTIQLLSLELVDKLVKNCGMDLHLQVASEAFMQDMLSMIVASGTEVDEDVQKRAILIIQCWGESFKPYREIIPLYYEKYKELKFRGVANPYNWFKFWLTELSGIRFPRYYQLSNFSPLWVRSTSFVLLLSVLIPHISTNLSAPGPYPLVLKQVRRMPERR